MASFTSNGLTARYAVLVTFADSTKPVRLLCANWTEVKARLRFNCDLMRRQIERCEGRAEFNSVWSKWYAAHAKRDMARFGSYLVATAAAEGPNGLVSATIEVTAA